jgi:hypothetical protein
MRLWEANIIHAGGVSVLISSTPEACKAIFDCAGISAAQPRLRFACVMLPKPSDEKLTGLEPATSAVTVRS